MACGERWWCRLRAWASPGACCLWQPYCWAALFRHTPFLPLAHWPRVSSSRQRFSFANWRRASMRALHACMHMSAPCAVAACGGEESSENSRRSQEGLAKAVSVTGLLCTPSHRIEVGGRQRAQGVVHVRTLPAPRTQRVFLCVLVCVGAGGCRTAMCARERGREMTGQIVCKRGHASVCACHYE